MGVEVRPLGVTCNIQCQYCYQNPQRDAGNMLRTYDVSRMLSAIDEEGGPFTLFGGEALMVSKADLETLWAWGFEKYGTNGIQTNGVLIDDDHIDLFKRYRVHVGISIDGPGELNDVRWGGSLEQTRANTAKTEAAIERLCREGIPPSLIVTLSRCNATSDTLPVLHDWFRNLERLGVQSARLHVLEVESEAVRAKYALSTEENLRALLSFVELERDLTGMKLDLFQDMRRLLLGQDASTTCVWNACDPYTTVAVRGVEGNGQRSNCGRTNKDGIDFVKADAPGFERYLALYHTPQEFGGCKECRFFLQCKGQCPGTAIDGDWRNRTEHCLLWKKVFREIEERLIDEGHLPLSVNPDRKQVELSFVKSWAAGRNMTIRQALNGLDLRTDGGRTATWASSHGDVPHGDSSHRGQGAPASVRTETPDA